MTGLGALQQGALLVIGLVAWFAMTASVASETSAKMMLAVFFVLVFIFDRSSHRRRFWGAYLAGLILMLASASDKGFNYSSYLMLQCGLLIWLGGFFTGDEERAKGFSLAVIVIFLMASFAVFFQSFSVAVETRIFLGTQLAFAFLPLALERGERFAAQEQWFAVVAQQTAARFFFLIWAHHYRVEILSFKYFADSSLFLVALGAFVVFFGLINWSQIRWEYLYESFLTLLIGYVSLADIEASFHLALLLSGWHFLSSFDKDLESRAGAAGYVHFSMQNGGFGGVGFLISLLLMIRLSSVMETIDVVFWMLGIFAFGWAAWASRPWIGERASGWNALPARIALHLLAVSTVLVLFERGYL